MSGCTKIKAMFFDVAKTLLDYDNAIFERLAQWSGKSTDDIRLLLCGTTKKGALYMPDSLVYRFDAGAIGVKGFTKAVRRKLGISSQTALNEHIRNSFLYCFYLREGMEPLVRYLSKQFIVGITSNINRLMWEHWCEEFPFLSPESNVFSFYTLSFREKLMKPGPRFFITAFKEASRIYETHSAKKLLPEECLVFDDRQENILTAEALQMHGILVNERGYRDIVRELRCRYHIVVDLSIFEHA